MGSRKSEQLQILQVTPKIVGARIGKIVASSTTGLPIVDFPVNPLGPQLARKSLALAKEILAACQKNGHGVLLLFEDNDPARPIIVDAVVGHLAPPTRLPERSSTPLDSTPSENEPSDGSREVSLTARLG